MLVFNDIANKAATGVMPLCIGEMGPIKVDNDFMSSIPGLFCAGDICYGGSRVPGAIPAPPGRTRGSGLPFASFSGRKSGRAAIQYVEGMELGFSPYPFGLAVCYAASLTFATPLANAKTALTMVSGYQFKDYFLYNFLLEVLVLAGIMIFVPLIFPF